MSRIKMNTLDEILDRARQWATKARSVQIALDTNGGNRDNVARQAGRMLDLAEDIERSTSGRSLTLDRDLVLERVGRVKIMRARLECMVLPTPDARVSTLDVSIHQARYGGSYEGDPPGSSVEWFTWIGDIDWLDDAWADDVGCAGFWEDYRGAPVGRGSTPNDALEDIVRQAREVKR